MTESSTPPQIHRTLLDNGTTEIILTPFRIDLEEIQRFMLELDEDDAEQKMEKSEMFGSSGAVSSFLGITRDYYMGRKVARLEYECYIDMAVKQLGKICSEMRTRFSDDKDEQSRHISRHHGLHKISVWHRTGEVPVGHISVAIHVSSGHRRQAIDAVAFCIDELKATVPIWKKEWYVGDEFAWKENVEAAGRVFGGDKAHSCGCSSSSSSRK